MLTAGSIGDSVNSLDLSRSLLAHERTPRIDNFDGVAGVVVLSPFCPNTQLSYLVMIDLEGGLVSSSATVQVRMRRILVRSPSPDEFRRPVARQQDIISQMIGTVRRSSSPQVIVWDRWNLPDCRNRSRSWLQRLGWRHYYHLG